MMPTEKDRVVNIDLLRQEPGPQWWSRFPYQKTSTGIPVRRFFYAYMLLIRWYPSSYFMEDV